ncbi:MAG: pseudoazurin [Pseudomonadota bacterium]
MSKMNTGQVFLIAGGMVALSACGGGDAPAATEDTSAPAAAEVVEETTEVAEAVEETVEVAEAETTDAVEDAVETAAEEVTEAAEEVTEAAEDVVEEVTEEVEAAPAAEGTGQVIEVGMYTVNPDNRRETMVFTPNLLQLNVGDTVKWVPTELSHQSASIPGMIPEGAEPWYSQINKEVSYTFTQPGIYGYQCVPHYSGGMVGLIVVEGEGKLDNLEAAKAVRQPGLAARRFDEIWAAAEAAGYLSE